MVTLPESVLFNYQSFSLYNSPYPAHAKGCAIDLYPQTGAPSPVAGTVQETRTVRAPPQPYAADHDHLLLIDTGEQQARILHVDPRVEPGDTVSVGTDLGQLIRSGYFAPWVDNHIHLGFRPPTANPYRASGSVPITVDVPMEPVKWHGSGTITAKEETFVLLDEPGHPDPGRVFAGIHANGGILDGGLPHYPGGGVLKGRNGPVHLGETLIGRATNRTVTWADIEVHVGGVPITGVSLGVYRDRLGVKLVSWDEIPGEVGESITVTLRAQPPP